MKIAIEKTVTEEIEIPEYLDIYGDGSILQKILPDGTCVRVYCSQGSFNTITAGLKPDPGMPGCKPSTKEAFDNLRYLVMSKIAAL